VAGAALLYKTYLHKPVAVIASEGVGLLGGTILGVPIAVVIFSCFIMLSRIGMW
jgi:hypothetical protein